MPAPLRVHVTTFVGALSSERAPVGGGVAVLEGLYPHLAAAPDLEATVLRPGARAGLLTADGLRHVTLPLPGLAGRGGAELLHVGEREYGRLAMEWERALAAHFARQDPAHTVVLANDISEGPPFAELARRGFRQVVLVHVAVGEFFARQYLGGMSAARGAQLWRGLRRTGLQRMLPELLGLVWDKEEQAARCARMVVPSAPLATALRDCYPESGVAERTSVVPWGVLGAPVAGARESRGRTLAELGVEPARFVLATMSRLSREKRLELLLRALRVVERRAPSVAERLALVVAGAPAYMGGARYAARLEREAARLRRVQVRFPGYVGGEARWPLLAAADLFCSTSAYEAYGLSIAQALAAGTPVLATPHQGARAILTEELGWTAAAEPAALARRIEEITSLELAPLRARAAAWGREHAFERAAERVLAVVRRAADGG